MAGKGNALVKVFILGLIVMFLVFIADIASVVLIIPLLVGSIFSGLHPTLILILSLAIAALMFGAVFTLAGFRRGKRNGK